MPGDRVRDRFHRRLTTGAAAAAALRRILDCGADPHDLTDVVRTLQHEVIYNVCQLLDDPALLGIRQGVPPDQLEAGWELMAARVAAPTDRSPIGELHTGLDERDPSGRGGEPRGRPIPARLAGQPMYARRAVAQARAGDRLAAVKTWRAATGATTAAAKAALDALKPGPPRPTPWRPHRGREYRLHRRLQEG